MTDKAMAQSTRVRGGGVPGDVERPQRLPLWKQLENILREWVSSGKYPPGSQFPPDRQIAEMLGANRLTVRRALANLAQQGMLRIEHGLGTFVERPVHYKFGERVSFSRNLKTSGFAPSRKILSAKVVRADKRLASKLGLRAGARVIRIDLIGLASGVPIGIGSKYFPYSRFPNIEEVFNETKSFSEAFRRFGVEDYVRKYTNVIGRLPSSYEARELRQPKTSVVLAYESVDVDLRGVAVAFQEGCLCGDRVMIVMEGESRTPL
jgi:GntR family phosphonate transport system transcriptional regulator